MSTAPPIGGSTDDRVQLCAFLVGDESYVIDIMRIREIVNPHPVTPVRRGDGVIDGVIDLRGQVIPVVDLRRRLGLPPRTGGSGGKQMIVALGGRVIGFAVDGMGRVMEVSRASIQASPDLRQQSSRIFPGVVNHGGRIHLLLNLQALVDEPGDPQELAAWRDAARHHGGTRG